MKKTRVMGIRGRVIEAEICGGFFSRARGLMFRRKARPLLFSFKRPTRQSIHSFFCKPFLAIWLNNGKIIEEKIVRPFSLSIKPEKPFTEIVEIPLKNNNNNRAFFDDNRKI